MAEAQEYLDEYLSLMDHGSSSQQFRKDLEALPQGSSFDSRSSPAFRSSLSMQDALYDPYLDDSDSSSMYASPLCRCIDHEPGPICPKDLPDEWSVQNILRGAYRVPLTDDLVESVSSTPSTRVSDSERLFSPPMVCDKDEEGLTEHNISGGGSEFFDTADADGTQSPVSSTTGLPSNANFPPSLPGLSHLRNMHIFSAPPVSTPYDTAHHILRPSVSTPPSRSSLKNQRTSFTTSKTMELPEADVSVADDVIVRFRPRRAAALEATARMKQKRKREEDEDEDVKPTTRRWRDLGKRRMTSGNEQEPGGHSDDYSHPHGSLSITLADHQSSRAVTPSSSSGDLGETFQNVQSDPLTDDDAQSEDEVEADGSGEYLDDPTQRLKVASSSSRKRTKPLQHKSSPKSQCFPCPGEPPYAPCSETFTKVSDISRHLARCKSKPESEWTVKKCPVCGTSVSRSDSLKRHIGAKHSKVPAPTKHPAERSRQKRNRAC